MVYKSSRSSRLGTFVSTSAPPESSFFSFFFRRIVDLRLLLPLLLSLMHLQLPEKKKKKNEERSFLVSKRRKRRRASNCTLDPREKESFLLLMLLLCSLLSVPLLLLWPSLLPNHRRWNGGERETWDERTRKRWRRRSCCFARENNVFYDRFSPSNNRVEFFLLFLSLVLVVRCVQGMRGSLLTPSSFQYMVEPVSTRHTHGSGIRNLLEIQEQPTSFPINERIEKERETGFPDLSSTSGTPIFDQKVKLKRKKFDVNRFILIDRRGWAMCATLRGRRRDTQKKYRRDETKNVYFFSLLNQFPCYTRISCSWISWRSSHNRHSLHVIHWGLQFFVLKNRTRKEGGVNEACVTGEERERKKLLVDHQRTLLNVCLSVLISSRRWYTRGRRSVALIQVSAAPSESFSLFQQIVARKKGKEKDWQKSGTRIVVTFFFSFSPFTGDRNSKHSCIRVSTYNSMRERVSVCLCVWKNQIANRYLSERMNDSFLAGQYTFRACVYVYLLRQSWIHHLLLLHLLVHWHRYRQCKTCASPFLVTNNRLIACVSSFRYQEARSSRTVR